MQPLSDLKKYQISVAEMLQGIYIGTPIQTEWRAISDGRKIYSPRLDIAVGPFAINQQYIDKYDDMMNSSQRLINKIIELHVQNIRDINNSDVSLSFDVLKRKNYNARCFLAIEIENKVSRKHLIGGAINAAALGRIGIVVAWTPEKLKAFIKLREYLEFLGSVGKNTFDTTNLLILDKNQLFSLLDEFILTLHISIPPSDPLKN